MNRRGFLASLLAFAAAPFASVSRPHFIPSDVVPCRDIYTATYSFWQNQRQIGQSSPSYTDSLSSAMRAIYADCEKMDARG